MSIFPEKDGKGWTGRWTCDVQVKGQRFKATLANMQEAEDYERYCKKHGQAPGTTGGLLFREVAEMCKAAGGPRGVWHDGRDRSMIDRLNFVLTTRLGDMPIKAIGSKHLLDFVTEMRRRPASLSGGGVITRPGTQPRKQSTINRYLDAISAVFTFAHNYTPKLVDEKLKMPKVREIAGRTAILAEEQEAALCRWMVEQGHGIVATCVRFLTTTGLRRGEFEKLSREQIMHDHIVLFADQTKTNSCRKVFLPPEMAREMRAIVATGARPRVDHLAKVFKRAVRALGYSTELCIHSLRHTAITRMLQRGANIKDVQEIAGHSLITTTQRYAHSDDDHKREVAQKLSGTSWDFAGSSTEVPHTQKAKLH